MCFGSNVGQSRVQHVSVTAQGPPSQPVSKSLHMPLDLANVSVGPRPSVLLEKTQRSAADLCLAYVMGNKGSALRVIREKVHQRTRRGRAHVLRPAVAAVAARAGGAEQGRRAPLARGPEASLADPPRFSPALPTPGLQLLREVPVIAQQLFIKMCLVVKCGGYALASL